MKKYGRLTVIKEYKTRTKSGRSQRRFLCLCDCGKETDVEKGKILAGITKSCGCLREETYKKWADNRRLGFGESAMNQVYGVYKKSAVIRGHEFLLTKDDFLEIVTKPCIYCGSSLSNMLDKKDGYGSFKYTGIDRYDNNLGYTKENSVPCCSICNRIKTNLSIDFMYNHLQKIIKNHNIWQRTA